MKTFICAVCSHKLPVSYEHEERPGVCFLDYVSESDEERIAEVVREAKQMIEAEAA
jgi:hypothetical protein